MAKFLNNISLEQANDIQFKNTAGTNTGKIEADGNDLVLSNSVGDILIGDGASDVYIGDGTNSVDILFEQSGSIKAEDGSSGVTLTLGSSDTTLAFGGNTSFADIVSSFSSSAANTVDIGTSANPFKNIYAGHHIGSASINYATSRGWVEDPSPMDQTQVGEFGGDFTRNGDNTENEVVWGLDPFGNKALLWKSIGQTSDDDDDGGFNKNITIPANNNIGYLSYVYFMIDFTPDTSSDGQFYHGCGGGTGETLNVNGTNNTNPYFNSGAFLGSFLNNGSWTANRWYVSIGIIQPYNNSTTDTDTFCGVYDVETGQKMKNGGEFKMGNNATSQRHRTYLYYQSSTSSGNMYIWNPGFHAIDGSEPKLQDLVKRQTIATTMKVGRDADNLIDFTTDNQVTFRVGNVNQLVLNQSRLAPSTNDGSILGSASLGWSDLFLASGAVVNFNNGDVTLTHSGNNLAIAGGNLEFTGYGIVMDGNTITGIDDSDEFTDDDNHIMTSAGIDDRITTRISGLTSNVGDYVEGTQLTAAGIEMSGELDMTGNGDKYIDVYTLADSDNFTIRHHNPTGNAFETAFKSTANGTTTLFYDGSTKFATKSDGVDVTGEVQCDTLDVDGNADISGTLTLGGDVTIINSIIHAGDSNTYFGFHNVDEWRVVTGGTERFEITNSGATFAGTVTANGTVLTGATDITGKVSKTGDTMTGSLTIDGEGSSTDVLKLKGSARIQMENASATDSFYISNTGGSGASTLDLGGALSIVEGGASTFAGTLTIPSYIYHAGDPSTDTYFGFNGNDNFTVVTAGGNGLVIDSNRNAAFTGDITVTGGQVFLTANNYAIENVGGNYGVRNSSGNYGGNDGSGVYTAPQDFFHIPGTVRIGPKYATSDRDYIRLIPAGTTSTIEMPNENAYIHNNSGNIVLRTGTSTDAVTVTGANTTFAGDVILSSTAPTLRIQDSRNLNVGDWDNVSLGNIEFYTSDTTSPGARVLAEIEAFSNAAAASGPNADLIFKTSAIGDSSPQTRLTIGYNGTSTFTGNVTAGSNSLTAGSLDINGNADISGNLAVDGIANLDNTDIDGTFNATGTTFDVNSSTSLTLDNTNTTNGVKINTATSGSPVTIGHTTSEVIIGDNLVVNGNLTTKGDTILESTTNTTIKDTVIQLNDGVAAESANTSDTGILINRGSLDKVFMGWDETADKFVLATTSSAADAAAGTLSGLTTEANYQTLVANIIAPTMKIGFGNSVGDVHASSTSTSLGTSNTLVPTQNAVKSYVDGLASNYATSAQGTLATNALPKAGGTMTGVLTCNHTSDNKIDLTVNSSDNTEWNYIQFIGSNGTRDAYFGTTNDGTPSWYRDDGATQLRLDNAQVYANKMLKVNGELEATSLDINGNADISGNLTGVDNLTINGTLTGVSTATFAGDVQLLTSSGEYALYGAADAQTQLYHNGIKKLETTSSGIDVTGEVQCDTLDVDGNADISGTLDVGAVNADGNITVTKSSATVKVEESGGADVRIVAGGSTGYIGTYSNDTLQIQQNSGAAITIDTSRNSTFAGTVNIVGTNSTNQESVLLRGITANGGDLLGSIRTANTGGYNQEMRFYTSNADGTSDEDLTLTLKPDQSATFSGSVISTDGSDTTTLSHTGLVLSRSNSYIQSNADNSDTLNIGQSSVRWGHVKVDSATFKVLNGGTERFGINSSGNSSFYGDLSNVGASHTVSLSSGSNIRGSNHLFIQGDASYVHIKSNGNNVYLDGVSHNFRNVAANTSYLVLDSTRALFNGEVEATSLDINGNADISGNLTGCAYQGDVIASAYLDADTMHLGVSQDITANKEFQDNVQARFGSDNDMLIQHTGSHGYWDCETGNMYIRAEADNSHIYLQADDGSGGNTTYIDINGNNERITMMKPVKMDQRRFALTTSTDGDHQGDVVFFGGTSTTVGKIYYYTSSGTWAETNAHAVATADGLLAVALGSSSDTDGMLLRGMVTLNHDPGTIGDPIYLDEANNGQAHSSIPAGTGDIVRVVGYCVHNTQGRIWFNPDNTFVEVA